MELDISLYFENESYVEDDQEILQIVGTYATDSIQFKQGNVTCSFSFRLEKVSRRKDGRKFMVRIEASQDEGYPDTVHGCYSTPINCLSKRRTFAKKRLCDDDSRLNKKNKKKMTNRNSVIAVNNMISSQAAAAVSSPGLLDANLSDFQFRVNTVMSTLSNKIDMLIDTINGQRVEIRDLKFEVQSLRVNGATSNNNTSRADGFSAFSEAKRGGGRKRGGGNGNRNTLTDTGRLNSLTQLLAGGMEALGSDVGASLSNNINTNNMTFSSIPRPGTKMNNSDRDDFSYLRNNNDSNSYDVQDDINNAKTIGGADLDGLEKLLMESDHPAKDEFKREYEKGGRNGLFRFVSEDYERLKSLAPSTPDLLRVLSTNSMFNCYNKNADTSIEDWSGGTKGEQHSSSNNPLHILTTTAAM